MHNPQDPIGPIGELAIQLHEMFDAYVRAGFTRNEALELVKTVITAHATQGDN